MRPGVEWLSAHSRPAVGRRSRCTTPRWPASSRCSSGSPCRARSPSRERARRHVPTSGAGAPAGDEPLARLQARAARGAEHAAEEGAVGRRDPPPRAQVGKTAFEAIVGVFFTFATAAYWIFDRDRARGARAVGAAAAAPAGRLRHVGADRPQARRVRARRAAAVVFVGTLLSPRSGPSACRTGCCSGSSPASSSWSRSSARSPRA